MRILIGDGNSDVLSALEVFFKYNGQKNSVAKALSYKKIIKKIEELDPEVILLDWESFSDQIKDIIDLLDTTYPHIYLIIISDQKKHRKEALKIGADAFLLKGDSQNKFKNAVYGFKSKKEIDPERKEKIIPDRMGDASQ